MSDCERCKKPIIEGDERAHNEKTVCEDCYIDLLLSPVRKMYYENDASGFMLRLKDAYIAHPQQYH
ncbi:MAG: hypothetical protein GY859_29280 [Desulfobacterales bacterium]|nr:hypothetical protein [Desulfobacterales bacterium]